MFGTLGLLWFRFGAPAANRIMRFPPWHETRWVRIWNFGVFGLVAVAGVLAILIGFFAWSTGHTFA